jgi:hypothetical protein
MTWCNAAMIQILMLMLFRAGLPVLIVMGNMQKIMQNIIESPYSPQKIKMLESKQRHLLAAIVPPLGRITSQMTNVTNQNLKV